MYDYTTMKCRKNFISLKSDVASTHVSQESLTRPDMSLSIKEILARFAYVGDTPVGLLPSFYDEPDFTEEDKKLLETVDVEQLDIAELEDLSIKFKQKADYLRSLPPARTASDTPADTPADTPEVTPKA